MGSQIPDGAVDGSCDKRPARAVAASFSVTNRLVEKLKGFTDLTAQECLALGRSTGRVRKLAARQDLIREGDRPGPVFVVLDGWMFRYKLLADGNRQVMAFLMPGDSSNLNIGMLTAMDHSIQAASPARIAMIPRAEIGVLLNEYPGIARAMHLAQLCDEGTMRAWIVSMGRRGTVEQVAHLMCELYTRAKFAGLTDGGNLDLPVSQIVLADALGMTPVHFSRVLKKLRPLGAMTLRRGLLQISDFAALARIAGFEENYLHRRDSREPASL